MKQMNYEEESHKWKEKYAVVEIPPELSQIVQNEIDRNKEKAVKQSKLYLHRHVEKAVIRFVAILFLILFVGVNTNETFAATLNQIPVIGNFFRVITFQEYKERNSDYSTNVKMPGLVTGDTQYDDFINSEINAKCQEYIDCASGRIGEYKEAFIATGGTEEEFEQKNIDIVVDYEIMYQTSKYVSFIIYESESWNSSYLQTHYYNLDLERKEYITLKDLLGDNFIALVNEAIEKDIRQREENGETYFSVEEGGFQTISDTTNFYINEAGNPVIVFEKFEIATGSMGRPEFEISIHSSTSN